MQNRHVVVTGAAGYIGSLLTGELLRQGYRVTVIDNLLYGGESLLSYLHDPNFSLYKGDVCEPRILHYALEKVDEPKDIYAIIHLAGIVGFPACQLVGRQVAWKYNVEATQNLFEQALEFSVQRFIYNSVYSNYISMENVPVTEDTPQNPQSLYAETKVASEGYLLGQKNFLTAPIIFRAATPYGLSPRTRFDVTVNQFVLDAYQKRDVLIYQRGYSRSFLHVYDLALGLILGLTAPEEKVRGQVYNLGSSQGNYTKKEIIDLILRRLPTTNVRYKDQTFGGNLRDIIVSFEKIETELGFKPTLTLEDGIREVLNALRNGMVHDPQDTRSRNAFFVVQ
ncbi:MAG: NAD(P)-dependent oxidoreductase [Anaerolineales bacterium]|nr:NAD(P)-dependent oxidoreductase [Anaerolineales bacterium]